MDTIIYHLNSNEIDQSAIEKAGDIIKNGGLVAFPTETVYGLGGDAMNAKASAKIYEAKGRPSDNPLIAHIASLEMLDDLVEDVPEWSRKLMEAFWPGPMTLIFHKKNKVPDSTTGGLETLAVRFPNHPVAQALIKSAGTSIAAPSANISGRPSPTKGEHVIEDLDGRIDCIIDGGEVEVGIESTIIDCTGDAPMILRPGYITKEKIEDVVGETTVDPSILEKIEDVAPKAPGMKYKHYAPKADFVMYRGNANKVAEKIIGEANSKDAKVGIITVDQHLNLYEGLVGENVEVISLGDVDNLDSIAHALFNVLREFDEKQVEYIIGETIPEENLGTAIMNRLTKASGYQVKDI